MTVKTLPLILVADDDEDILELVRLRLSRAGFDLVLARNGTEALHMARERHPDIAVLDVTMPGLDGYEVARELRADASTNGIQVILLTGRAAAGEVERGFEAGVDDYITKPFSPQALQARVVAALERSVPPESSLRLLA